MESWERILLSLNLKKYRLAQIIDWVYKKRIWSFSQMSNLSNEDRELLEGAVSSHLLKMQNKFVSADGTVKYLFGLGDGEIIETVLMKNRYGYSVCVSTQVGCNMGCVFCYSGLAKKKRNLLVYEMVQQMFWWNRIWVSAFPTLW
jgi:23S rRNA (adenine2503-C2)-methyltransferase